MGADMLEAVTVTVAGVPITAWDDISITIPAEKESVRTAQLTLTEKPPFPPWPDLPCTVTAGGTLILTGFVRDFEPDHNESDGPDIWSASLGLVSRAVDATESSVVHPTGRIDNADPLAIAQEFDSAGVGFEAVDAFDPVEWHDVQPGRSTFDEVERVVRGQGGLIHDTPEGKMRLARKPEGIHIGALASGVNIFSGSASFTGEGRNNPVVVRGQNSRGTTPAALRPEATAPDAAIGRTRPRVVLFDGEPSSDRLKKRAETEVRRAQGRAVRATITTPGWRDAAGLIWQPNWLVMVIDPDLYLAQMMAIASVTLHQTESGTRSVLSLVDPRAVGGEAPGGSSASGWAGSEPVAEYSAE